MPGAAKSPDFARTFVWIYNPQNAGIIIIPHQRRRLRISRTFIISKILSNQQVLRESARFLRIGKIISNQPDSRTRRIRATASLPSSHRPPQLAIASGSQPCSSIRHRGTLQTSSGSWAVILWAPEPLFSDSSFRCPVPFCGPFSLWPQALLIYAHGLCCCLMPAGPLAFIPKGPCPFC